MSEADIQWRFHNCPGVFISEGDTKAEALTNIKEAIELHIESLQADKVNCIINSPAIIWIPSQEITVQ